MGNGAGRRQDAPHGFGSHNLVLGSHAQVGAVAHAMTTATASLRSGSLTTPTEDVSPAAAQENTYAALIADPATEATSTKLSAALGSADANASASVAPLVRSFAARRTNPALIPSVVANYNDFTKAASSTFIANPPAEFLAMRAVLAQLSAATKPK